MKPATGSPLANAAWLMSAVNPAHRGAAQLVPPTLYLCPLPAKINTLSAVMATSGRFRLVVEPWLAVMSMPCCQLGIAYFVLMPPPVPVPPPQFQTVSET